MSEKIEVQNFTSPNHLRRVDKTKYMAMRKSVLAVLPDSGPGMTPAELLLAVKAIVPQDLFPGGDKAGWWMKCVQLDLEAKKIIARADMPPVRLRKV